MATEFSMGLSRNVGRSGNLTGKPSSDVVVSNQHGKLNQHEITSESWVP